MLRAGLSGRGGERQEHAGRAAARARRGGAATPTRWSRELYRPGRRGRRGRRARCSAARADRRRRRRRPRERSPSVVLADPDGAAPARGGRPPAGAGEDRGLACTGSRAPSRRRGRGGGGGAAGRDRALARLRPARGGDRARARLRRARALAAGWPEATFDRRRWRRRPPTPHARPSRTTSSATTATARRSRPPRERLWALLLEDADRLEEGAPLPPPPGHDLTPAAGPLRALPTLKQGPVLDVCGLARRASRSRTLRAPSPRVRQTTNARPAVARHIDDSAIAARGAGPRARGRGGSARSSPRGPSPRRFGRRPTPGANTTSQPKPAGAARRRARSSPSTSPTPSHSLRAVPRQRGAARRARARSAKPSSMRGIAAGPAASSSQRISGPGKPPSAASSSEVSSTRTGRPSSRVGGARLLARDRHHVEALRLGEVERDALERRARGSPRPRGACAGSR